MLFSMIAVIVIICLFIVAGKRSEKKKRHLRRYVWDFFSTGGMILLSAHFALILKKKAKEYERKEGIKVTLDILDAKK